MTPEKIKAIVEASRLYQETDGEKGAIANLRGVNLSGANLRGADLFRANLFTVDLSGANLFRADLSGANLSGANLRGADLFRANLSGADLNGANLRGADLSGADLRGADLRGADLRGASLSGADLSGANLRGADLFRADLSGADLFRANLSEIKADFQAKCALQLNELQLFRSDLVNGEVDGSTYDEVDGCACFIGSMEKYARRGQGVVKIQRESGSPTERWLLAIKRGDTPENSQIVAITLKWLDGSLARERATVA